MTEALPLKLPEAGPLFPLLPHVDGYGATRNMHVYTERRIKAVNLRLKRNGGLNPFGEATYRIVWGWDRPHLYGVGGGAFLEYFHLERWMDLTCYFTENEWEANELAQAREFGSRYQIQPFPRHGDYMEIATCWLAVADSSGKKKPQFRMPDSAGSALDLLTWDEGALIRDQLRLARTRGQIAEEVIEDQAFLKQLQTEKNQRIEDQFGIRELAEDMTHRLIRNPTLRSNPNFMLSPATGYKRVRHNIPLAS
jgi:hypothetical protein